MSTRVKYLFNVHLSNSGVFVNFSPGGNYAPIIFITKPRIVDTVFYSLYFLHSPPPSIYARGLADNLHQSMRSKIYFITSCTILYGINYNIASLM